MSNNQRNDTLSRWAERRKNKKNTSSKTNNQPNDTRSRWAQRRAFNELKLDTFESDLTSLNKSITTAQSGWQTQETMRNTLSSVQSMYDRLGKYQEYQKQYGGADLGELRKSYKAVIDNWDSLSKQYSGYKDKNSYDKAMKNLSDMATYDSEAGKKKISELEGFLKTAGEYASEINTLKANQKTAESRSHGLAKGINQDKIDAKTKEYNDFLKTTGYKSYEELEKALGNEKVFRNNATRYQEKIKLGSVGDVNSEFYDPDYDKYVEKGKSVSVEDVGTSTRKRTLGAGKARPISKTVKSDTRYAAEALGAFLKGEELGDDKNAYDKAAIFDMLTEKEYNDIAYYIGKDSEDGGNRLENYLESIEETLNYRRAEEISNTLKGNTFGQYMFAVDAGLDQFATGTKNLFNTSDDYIPVNQVQYASGQIRDDILEDNGWLARTGYDLLNTSSNMLPSILVSSALGPAGAIVGAGMMGASASGNAYQEMLNLGYDKGQARAYSALVGVSEAALQYALGGIGKLGGTSAKIAKAVQGIDNGLARFAVRWGGSMLSEGFEEAAQEVLNPLFTNIAAGYDTGAEVDWSEVAYSGLLGALSGGFMEGPGIATNMVAEHHNNKITGQNIKDNARVDSVFKTAEFSPEESLAYKAYTNFAKKEITPENVSDAQLGRLAMLEKTDAQEVLDSKASTEEQRKAAQEKNLKLDEYAQYNPEEMTNRARTEQTVKAIGKDVESMDALVEEGLTFAEGTEAHKLATEYKAKLDNGKKLSKDEISKLTEANTKAVKGETLKGVTERLTELGEDEGASEIANIISKKILGGTISKEEANTLKGSKNGIQVLNENTEGVADYVKGMSAEESALFLQTYDGETNIEAFANSFNLVSEYAKHPESFTQEQVLENKGVLSTESALSIYTGLTIANSQAMKKANAEIRAMAKNVKRGTINDSIFNYGDKYVPGKVNWNTLNSREKQAVTFVKGLYKALGSNVSFLYKETSFNGAYNVTKDMTYVDVYAGKSTTLWTGKDSIITTISHELTHEMRVKSPEGFSILSNLVLDTLVKSPKYKGMTKNDIIADEIARLDKEHPEEGKHTEADAIDEIVARACEDMLAQSEEAKAMFKSLPADEQKNLAEKIKDLIQKVIDWIDEFLSSYKNQSKSKEAEALREMKEEFEAMRIMWDNMLRDVQSYNKSLESSATEESASEVETFEDASADGEITSIGSYDLTELSEAVDEDGKMLFQYRAMEADKEIYRDMLLKHKDIIGITNKQITELFDLIDTAVEIITKDELSLEALDYSWDADINDRAFNPVKPNNDSLYKVSLDFSTLCRKRLLQQTIQTTLQEALNKNLSKEESIAIRDELMKIQEEGRKIEIACALCYVESTRMRAPVQINKFLNNKEFVIRDFFASKDASTKKKIEKAEMDARKILAKKNPKGLKGKNNATLDALTAPKNAMYKKDADFIRDAGKKVKAEYKLGKAEQAELDAALKMKAVDFTSAEGLENLAKNHADIFDAYTSFVRNATHSKGLESDVWWRAGDSDSIGDNLIAQMNEENGLRSQSWSDFQVIHLLDYIAATIELSTKGAKRQSYTKVPDYVKLLGNTGDMINMSVIPERVFNGKLGYDDVEGMAYKVATELRKEYHKTAGIICIGIDDAQIRMLLEDTNIDMVIPYHASGMSKAVKKLMHIPEWKSYQSYQSESKLSDADAKAQADRYGVELKKDKNWQKAPKFSEWFDIAEARQIAEYENKNPSNEEAKKKYGIMYGGYMAMQNAANTYLKLCAERGLSPKFSHEKADFTNDANYWKLLIDRKMVDNVTGEVIEQQAIKPIFKEESVLEILNDELARYPQVKADQEYAQRKVTEKFLSGDMKMDKSTREAIKKPIDNVTKVNILESAEEVNLKRSDRDSEGNTLTEAQQEFFKDSKVRNYKGELRVVYHGGTVGNVFDTRRGSGGITAYGAGSYFTDSKYYAEDYAEARGGKVEAYYLNIVDFFPGKGEVETNEKWDNLCRMLKHQYGVTDSELNRIRLWGFGLLRDILNAKMNTPNESIFASPDLANRALRLAGYDGIIGEFNDGQQYVIFDPEQAKFTSNLNPTKNKDMRYADREGNIKKAEELTETDFRDLLEKAQNGVLEDSSYIPMRATTPEFFIDVVREHSEGKFNVMHIPMAAQVEHIRQNMEEEEDGISYGDARPHNLSVDDVVKISKEMGHPAYIVLQKNGRYAMVVSFYNKVNKKVVVSIDFASDKDTIKNYKYRQYMNGYNDGYYNIIVTQFEPDDLSSYLKNNEVVYDKKKMNGKYQVGFGRIVTFTHDIPFIKDIVSHKEKDVKDLHYKKDDIKYSDREDTNVYDLVGERDRLLKENEKWKAEVERLNERLALERKVTKGNYFNENQLGAVAGHLRKIANSNMDKVELMKALKDAYSFIAHSEHLTWEEVFERCYKIADAMLEKAKPEVMVDDYSKQILKEIRKSRISLSESQKKDAQSAFGNNWNRYFFGKVVITDNAVSLDRQWQEWASMYPDIFDADINDGDMVSELYEIIGSLQDASETIMEYESEEQKRWLANEIYNQYWNVSPIRTTADKYDKQIKLLNFKHRQAMKESREAHKARLEEQKKLDREKHTKLAKELRERRDRDVKKAKEHGKAMVEGFKERAERKTVIQSMTSTVMSLNKKLTTNSKDVHIPDSLKPVVIKLLNAIDFSSKQLLGMDGTKKDARGLPTKSDIATENSLSKVHSMKSGKADVVSLKMAIQDAVELFENAEKILREASDGTVDSSVVALDTDAIEDIKKMIKGLDILVEKGETTFVLQRMSTDHLKTLNGMVKSINHWAIVADKALANKHKKRVTDLAMQTVKETNVFGSRQEYLRSIEEIKNFFNWSNLLPVNAFKRFGDAAMEFLDGLRDSQDKNTFNRQEVMDFTAELLKKYKKYKPKDWRTEVKTFEVKLPGEKDTTKVTMPVSYIMTLYCVAKQEDARRHLYGKDASGNKLTYKDEKGNIQDGGGMTIKGFKEGKFSVKVNKNLDNTIVDEGIVKQITSVLTKEQMEVADALQNYMNTKGSEWGNAVSMALYGIKKFNVENYFPITVSPHTLNIDKIRDKKASMFSILNYGFSKERNPNAKQSIEIGDIFEIFANHMNMVSIYNAYALSVFDIARWYNFKGKNENGKEISVTASLEKAFGEGATTYVNNLIKDLNGQHESSRLGFVSKIFKHTKVAMVGNSISVTLLQPTAYLKAMVKVPPKYLLKSFLYVKDFGAQKGVEKAKKYCGIALLKSQGYFETGVSSSTTTKMLHDESLGEKATSWSLKGAEWMDERTWGMLWNACEFEVRAKRKDLKVGSEEFYKVVAEKLRDVIYETQVVDSPLTKSDLMRSSDTGAKMVTMFASEMTVAYNMVFEAAYQTHLDSKKYGKKEALKKNAKILSMTLLAYTMTSVANTAINALVESFRYGNDDEEDEYKFVKDFLMDWVIVSKIPYFKEIISKLQGYSSSRTDTVWLESAFKAYEYWGKEGLSMRTVDEILKSTSYVSGFAIYNQWRELKAFLRFIGVME